MDQQGRHALMVSDICVVAVALIASVIILLMGAAALHVIWRDGKW